MRIRLQKLLAAAGLASRREAEAWIRAGRVSVNGAVATLGTSADPESDEIRVNGRRIQAEPLCYWLLHKPRGVLTTTRDPHARRRGRPTVLDLLPPAALRARIFPVGRLDLDSEGLLLLTNDGAVAHALLHPSLGSEREYRVTVRGRLEPATVRRLEAGIRLADGPMAPCRIARVRVHARRDLTAFSITLREGRKRQVRRALGRVGHPVVRLVRTRMGPIRLGKLRQGSSRPLREAERRMLVAHALARSREVRPRADRRRRRRGGS